MTSYSLLDGESLQKRIIHFSPSCPAKSKLIQITLTTTADDVTCWIFPCSFTWAAENSKGSGNGDKGEQSISNVCFDRRQPERDISINEKSENLQTERSLLSQWVGPLCWQYVWSRLEGSADCWQSASLGGLAPKLLIKECTLLPVTPFINGGIKSCLDSYLPLFSSSAKETNGSSH